MAAGSAILISLPERERLPTAALFSAADEVLPRNGFALEDVPHISKLLFQIGGTRGQGSLLDKFRTVLEGMGIELVYTDTELDLGGDDTGDSADGDVDSTGDAPLPRVSVAPQDPRDDSTVPNIPSSGPPREAAKSPSPMHYAPSRRRNSDSIVLGLGTNGNQLPNGTGEPVSRMGRSQSNAGLTPSDSLRKEVRFSDVVDSQSVSDVTWDRETTGAPTFDDIPFRPNNHINGDASKGTNGSAERGDQEEDARPSTSAENRPPPDFSHFGELAQNSRSRFPNASGEVLSEEEFSSISMDLKELANDESAEEPSLPQHPGRFQQSSDALDRESTDEDNDQPHTGYSTQLPVRDAKDEAEMEDGQIAFIASREQMFKMSSFNHWRDLARRQRSHNIRLESHAERWDAWETMGEALGIWIETALTMQVDENDAVRIYQEHLRQQAQECERENASVDTASLPPTPSVLSKGNVNPRIRQSIERSRDSLVSVPRSGSDNRSLDGLSRQASQSVERTLIDEPTPRSAPGRESRDSQIRGLRSFGSHWQQGGDADEGEYYDASEQFEPDEPIYDEVTIRSKYQIAAAGWDFFLLSKSLTHWANRAEEEVERTQIARRHILRRRCFGAWLGEHEKDETEAESKATWFAQMVAMREWHDNAVAMSIKTRGLKQAAVRIDGLGTAENAVRDWYHEAKMRQASKIDSQRTLTACFDHWHAESAWLDSAHEEAQGIFSGSLLGRYMRHWREGARIQERAEAGAEPLIARRDEFLRSGLSLAWRQEAEEARNQERIAVIRDLSEYTKHWVYETRLIQWQEEQDYELLDNLTYHWYCEWRLVLCQRVIEHQEKARFFEKWTGAAVAQSARSYHLRQLAADVRHHDSITGFFNSGLESLEQLEMQAYHARGLIVQRIVPRVVRKWVDQFNQHQQLNSWSQLAQTFSVGENVLPHWQAIRKQEWQRRMQRIYKDFRQRVRLDTVTDVFDTWRTGTADNVTKGWEADNMHDEEDNAMVASVAEAWQSKLELLIVFNEVAEDNDRETHLIQWNSLLEVVRESSLDAEEWDFAQTAYEYWDEWRLASLDLPGRERTAQDFLRQNTRRDRQRYFAMWASLTPNVDSVPEMDFRTSRRGVGSRWTTPAPRRSRLMTDYTPFRTPAKPNFGQLLTTTTPAYRPPSEITFDEGDE